MTNVSEFRGKTVDELNDQIVKLKKEQFNLRFQRASGHLENTARVRVVRHDIARIMTVLNQRGESATVASPAAAKPKKAKAEKKEAAPKEAKKAPAKADAKEDKKLPAKKSRAKKE